MQVGASDVCDVGEAINLEMQSASVEFAALGQRNPLGAKDVHDA
jgi:hypothetical protein